MTTFALSCVNAGFFGGGPATPMVFGLAFFYGVVQLLDGMWAFCRGETFAAVTFSSYGGGLAVVLLPRARSPRVHPLRGAVHPGARARPVLHGHLPVAWNREHAGVAATPTVALDWSVTAMTEAAGRLATARL